MSIFFCDLWHVNISSHGLASVKWVWSLNVQQTLGWCGARRRVGDLQKTHNNCMVNIIFSLPSAHMSRIFECIIVCTFQQFLHFSSHIFTFSPLQLSLLFWIYFFLLVTLNVVSCKWWFVSRFYISNFNENLSVSTFFLHFIHIWWSSRIMNKSFTRENMSRWFWNVSNFTFHTTYVNIALISLHIVSYLLAIFVFFFSFISSVFFMIVRFCSTSIWCRYGWGWCRFSRFCSDDTLSMENFQNKVHT